MTACRLLVIAVAGAAFIASADRVGAEEKTRTPDLTELKYTITAAEKRGENVAAICEALAAFEKALTKNTLKAGEAPPELAELRDTVEMAAKKGENVAAISKELGVIEKAMTGREYERPKPPEPVVEPEPQFPPRRGGAGFGRNGGGIVIGRGGNGVTATSMTIVNGNFTIRARQGDVDYTITGSVNGNESPKITIQDGKKKIETEDLTRVPEEYRPTADRLLKMINRRR